MQRQAFRAARHPVPIGCKDVRPDELKSLLEQEFPECTIEVNQEGSLYFNLVLIGERFADKTVVQRHQMVYRPLRQQINAGELHALNVKTYTPEEWRQLNAADRDAPKA